MADIARRAGVSLATASRALNNAYGVAPTTRARVLEVAATAEYVVSPEASRLAGGKTHRVGLLVPHVERWFFGAMVAGLEAVLSAAASDVLLYHVDSPADRTDFFAHLPARRKVDGLVVVAIGVEPADRKRLDRMGISIVAVGGLSADYPYVSIDDQVAGRQAVDHLIGLGHRRIGMIETVDPDFEYRLARPLRSTAYYAALKAAGIPRDRSMVIRVRWGGTRGADAMERLLARPHPPTAVFAHSDEIALGALRSIRRAGLRVPKDISVVGIDDHPLAELVDLTTVSQPVREQGGLAAEMLLTLLRGEQVDSAVTLPTHLVVRGSTAAPRERVGSRRTGR